MDTALPRPLLPAAMLAALALEVPLRAADEPLLLARGGTTAYAIALAAEAAAPEQTAAHELATYLQRVTGAEFALITLAATPAGTAPPAAFRPRP